MATRRAAPAVIAVALMAASLVTASGAAALPDPVTCDQRSQRNFDDREIVDDDGVVMTTIADPDSWAGWSDDGRALAWIRRDGPQPNEDGIPDGYVANVVIADGTGTVTVEVPRTEFGGDLDFVWWGRFGSQLKVAGADGTYVVTRDGDVVGGPYAGDARLSPDGRHIAFFDATKTLRIRRVADGVTVDVVGPLDASVAAFVNGIRWSADSTQIIYWQGAPFDSADDGTYVAGLDGVPLRLDDSPRILFSGGPAADWLGPFGEIVLRDYVILDSTSGATAGGLLVGRPGGPYTAYDDTEATFYEGATPDGALIFLNELGDVPQQLVVIDRRTNTEVLRVAGGALASVAADGRFLVVSFGSFRALYGPDGTLLDNPTDNFQMRPCPAFGDVAFSSFAIDDVAVIAELEITTGTSELTYSPGGPVTRAQMAAFLARLWEALGNECGGTPGEFVDVPSSSFAYEPVACIRELGITNGTSPTTYGPAQFVTREQMAAFIARFWRAV